MNVKDLNQVALPSVLVIDDDIMIRVLVREALEQVGLTVHEAGTGMAGLEAYQEKLPDIILLDVELPDMDGFEVCHSLRSLPGGDDIAIMMVTGLDDVDSINKAYECGITDFVTKPINWPILGYRVHYLLRSSNAFRKLKISENSMRALMQAMPDMILRIHRSGKILDFHAGQEITPVYDFKKNIGKNLVNVVPEELASLVMRHVDAALTTDASQCYEYEIDHLERRLHREMRVAPCEKNEVVALIRDIEERKQAEHKIRSLAYYDSLTHLPNRQFYLENLNKAIAQAARFKEQLAVLFLDLDRFKRINDTLGHSAGDTLLKVIADRISNCVREYDIVARADTAFPNYQVARLGGDEFTVMLDRLPSPDHAIGVAQRIIETVSEPVFIERQEIEVTPSIGISIYPQDGLDAEALLKNADTAMYAAKERGRNNFEFYSKPMNDNAFERLNLESKLRRATERNELVLHYQPQINAMTGKVVGIEALVRWQSPDKGLIFPNDFIPLAEETGLINQIGEWVLYTACRQNKALQEAGLPAIPVSVNVSGQQFRQKKIVGTIKRALQETGLEPQYLDLEITEHVMMQLVHETVEVLAEIKALGVSLSIDDFGTGYSSLSYLQKFPIDTLKIDRAFVRDISLDPNDAAITRAIIAMARSLKLEVIAEGVESQEQLDYLKNEGCPVMQGYLYSKPLPVEALIRWLKKE